MQFYRGYLVIVPSALRFNELTGFVRMWKLRALVAAFLLGLVTGVALGYGARALRVPGFSIRVSLKHHAPRTPVAMRAAVARSQGKAAGWVGLTNPLPRCKRFRGKLPGVEGGWWAESLEPFAGRG
jgi:hypothetical protein